MESTLIISFWIFRFLAMWRPSLNAQSSTVRTEEVLIFLENPWTQIPSESRINLPAPASLTRMEASLFSFNQWRAGLTHLVLVLDFGAEPMFRAVRKGNSQALAIHSLESEGFACLAWWVTQFLFIHKNQIPNRNKRDQGMWWCRESRLDVQFAWIHSWKGSQKRNRGLREAQAGSKSSLRRSTL